MVLVTGATGLVGSYVCRELLKEGIPCIGLKRAESSMELVSNIREYVQWDQTSLFELTELQQLLNKVDAVINCAGMVSFSKRDRDELHEVNVKATANLVNCALKAGVPRFLQVSSIAAIGKSRFSEVVNEKNKLENAPSAYARSKYLGELEVWRGMAEGLSAVIVNPSVILGPGNWKKGSTRLFHYIWSEKPFYLQGKINYVDVRDNATIIVQLLQQETINNERYILNAGVVSYQQLFKGIAHHFGKKTPGIKVSSGMIRQAARLDKLRATLTGKPQLITDELADAAKGTVIYSNNKILNLVDYSFRELDNTLAYTCKELKNRYTGCNV